MTIKHKILAFMLCFFFIFMAVLLPPLDGVLTAKAKAFDFVITPSALAAMVVGTIFVGAGVYFSTDADFQTAVAIGYTRASQSVRDIIDAAAETIVDGGNRVIDFTVEQTTALREWIQSLYPDSSMEYFDGVGNVFNTSLQVTDNAVISSVPPLMSVPRSAGEYEFDLGSFSIKYTVDQTQTFFSLTLLSGVIVGGGSIPIGYSASGSNPLDLCIPIVSTYAGYDQVYFMVKTWIGETYWSSQVWGATPYQITVGGNTYPLQYYNGRVYYSTGGGTSGYVYLDEYVNQFSSFRHWLWSYLSGLLSLPIAITAARWGWMVNDFPMTDGLTIDVPEGELPDVRVADPAAVATSTPTVVYETIAEGVVAVLDAISGGFSSITGEITPFMTSLGEFKDSLGSLYDWVPSATRALILSVLGLVCMSVVWKVIRG